MLFKKVLVLAISGILVLAILSISILWAFSNNLPDYKFLKIIRPQYLVKFTQEMES